MKKIVVLISGNGSTLQAIINACQTKYINAEISTVISNKASAFGLQRAKLANIPTVTFLRNNYHDNLSMDNAIADYIESLHIDLIVLAGYMRILSTEFIQRFTGRILNIHPSLLPKYPGLNTYQRALNDGETEQGTTVHFVNEEVDGGAIILQAKVPVFAGDHITQIEARVRTQEIQIYPLVIKWFLEDRLQLIGEHAYLDEQLLPPHGYNK